MKVALINLGRVNNALGGTEKVFFNMANNLSSRGFDVTAISYDSHAGEPSFPIDPSVHYINSCRKNFCYSLKKGLAKILSFSFDRKSRRVKRIKVESQLKHSAIKTTLDDLRPDVILSFQPETTYLLIDVLNVQIPVISMFHMSSSDFFERPEFFLFKSSLEQCACVQVLTETQISEALSKISPRKIVHIPNVVPQIDSHPNWEMPVIINVGRINRGKRQDLILKSFSLLKDKFPNWSVELWGETHVDSTYFAELQKLVDDLGLQGKVSFCGTSNQILKKLEQASIFLFPSLREGFPLALTEAMSLGLPVIGCRSSTGVNNLIKEGSNGFLSEDSPESIAEKLEQLIKSKSLRERFGKQAKEDMKSYSPEIVWDQWEQLLQSVVKSKAGEHKYD